MRPPFLFGNSIKSISINTFYIGDSLCRQNGMQFTTKDQDNDRYSPFNCATKYHGAWWYNDCHDSNLNGKYLGGIHTSNADGIEWRTWTGYYYSLKSTKMLIRRQ